MGETIKKNHWIQSKVDNATKKINQEIYERNNKTVELGFGDKVPSLGEEIKRIITRPIN